MKYWVDFSGFACVEAESRKDAERKMWDAMNNAFDGHTVCDDVWDIDSIEERNDEEEVVETFKPSQSELEAFWGNH